MNRTCARHLLLWPLLALTACASGAPSLGGGGAPAPHPGPGEAERAEVDSLMIPDDVRQDGGVRQALMERLRVQVMQRTRSVPESDRLVVREQLRRRLDQAGFFMEEVAYILSCLDYPRSA